MGLANCVVIVFNMFECFLILLVGFVEEFLFGKS